MSNIRYTKRPYLPHEHPKWSDYYNYLKQNITKKIRKKTSFTQFDQQIKQLCANENYDLKQLIEFLNFYFIRSFLHYSDFDFSRAYFNGYPSEQGVNSDSIEGAARSYPLLAAYIYNNKNETTKFYQKIKQSLSTAFLSATNKTHKGYWGDLKDYQQTICETADFALALWLSKNNIWINYSTQEKTQIINWLKQINKVKTVDNNWHLFIILTQIIIQDLTGEVCLDQDRYTRIKEFYVGEGWFRDGAKGNFDYYNSWGFHYALFWIDQISPDFDRNFIHQASELFSEKFKYLFSPCGFSFFGRSIIYRFAAPTGLICNMIQKGQADGQVKRIISTLLHFLIQKNSIKNGNFTQGLFDTDRRLLDSYSGSASALWSLRPFILLLYGAEKINFWSTPEKLLPIEINDFELDITPINLHIIGYKTTQEVIAIFKQNDYPYAKFTQAALLPQNIKEIFLECLFGCSFRPKNNLLRKGVTCYSSKLTLYLKPVQES